MLLALPLETDVNCSACQIDVGWQRSFGEGCVRPLAIRLEAIAISLVACDPSTLSQALLIERLRTTSKANRVPPAFGCCLAAPPVAHHDSLVLKKLNSDSMLLQLEAIASRSDRTPLGAPGHTTTSKKLLGTKAIATNGAFGRYLRLEAIALRLEAVAPTVRSAELQSSITEPWWRMSLLKPRL